MGKCLGFCSREFSGERIFHRERMSMENCPRCPDPYAGLQVSLCSGSEFCHIHIHTASHCLYTIS